MDLILLFLAKPQDKHGITLVHISLISALGFSYSLACTLMIWVDHNKVVLQNKSTYFDRRNKIHNFESSSKKNEMDIFQSK